MFGLVVSRRGYDAGCCGRSANQKGIVIWNEFLRKDGLLLPKQGSVMPDVIIYLTHGKDDAAERICFARIPAEELLGDRCDLC